MIGTILESERYYTIYGIGFYLVYTTYFALDHHLRRYSSTYVALAEKKRWYVTSNFIKAAYLAILSPYVLVFLYEALYLGRWDTIKIRNLGNIYAIPDGVSLLLVRKMSRSTKIHHTTVCIFNIINLHSDYAQKTIFRCMPVYASLSAMAYLVNFLLGCRYMDMQKPFMRYLSITTMTLYLSCCVLNWGWHAKYLSNLWQECQDPWCTYSIPIYMSGIAGVIWDDVILNYWLYKNIAKKSPPSTLKAE